MAIFDFCVLKEQIEDEVVSGFWKSNVDAIRFFSLVLNVSILL